MTWDAERDLDGEPQILKVSATDLSSGDVCERYLATKVRPFAQGKGWKRKFPPDRHRTPFPLGDVVDLSIAATRDAPLDDYQGREAWIKAEIDDRVPLRIVRPYLDNAARNALDAHTAIEDELGALEVVAVNPEIGPPERRLTVWGPLYSTGTGVSEFRRYRVGAVHSDASESDETWTRTAAWVAATYPTEPPPTRVRVVEVSLADASVHVAFDGTWDEARAMLDPVRPLLQQMAGGTTARPGHRCGECKIAGVCDELPRASGTLGQTTPGHASRSIAPSALETYVQCPARWLLDRELHLPKADDGGEAQVRGLRVHEWLDAAHRRGVGCSYDDLPNPDDGLGLAERLMTREEYELAFPILLSHVEVCELRHTDAELVGSERAFYAFDEDAQVVVVCKPDLTTSRDGVLVLTEVKTSMHGGPESPADAFNRTLQIPLMLSMLTHGLMQNLGYERAEVRLEYLTPAAARVWTWSTTNPEDVNNAEKALKRAATEWHTDHEWATRPGAHCAWCPVRQWCPDSERYLEVQGADSPAASPGLAVDDEVAPF